MYKDTSLIKRDIICHGGIRLYYYANNNDSAAKIKKHFLKWMKKQITKIQLVKSRNYIFQFQIPEKWRNNEQFKEVKIFSLFKKLDSKPF
jgi:hypothetical protein